MQSTPGLLPRKSHGQRSLVGYSPWGRKELDTNERLHFSEYETLSQKTLLVKKRGNSSGRYQKTYLFASSYRMYKIARKNRQIYN